MGTVKKLEPNRITKLVRKDIVRVLADCDTILDKYNVPRDSSLDQLEKKHGPEDGVTLYYYVEKYHTLRWVLDRIDYYDK